MGNSLCMPKKARKDSALLSRGSRRHTRSHRKMTEEEEIHRQALAMALQQHQLSQRFEGSMSRRIGNTSSRRRTLPDSVTNGKQVPDFIENIETKKFVLVHGEGFGAWCWYKSIASLEESGLQPVALDLAGCGIDHTDTSCIMTLAEYTKPLINYLEKLPEDEKVILVGHSCGGASISYASELYPKKISKAIFLTATMVANGQRPYDVFAEELASTELFMKQSQLFTYGNGSGRSPTALTLEKNHIKALYFNQTTTKDIALANVSMRPIPLKPIMEKLILTPENYGSVKRYYIQTLDDRLLSPDIQEKLVRENPPDGVYKIKGSDHCPFFSKPQSLNKLLLEIAQIT